MSITSKCFELLENRQTGYDLRNDGVYGEMTNGVVDDGFPPNDPLMSDDESDATEEEDEDDMNGMMGTSTDGDDMDSDMSDEAHDESDGDDSFASEDKRGPKLRIR